MKQKRLPSYKVDSIGDMIVSKLEGLANAKQPIYLRASQLRLRTYVASLKVLENI